MAKVLVVDDHPVNRNLVVTLLNYRGHAVLEAADGAEALAVVEAEHPDLVITDLLMPVMDGYELVRQLRAIPALATTRVIFYTANYQFDEARPLAAESGVHHILPKPADPDLLYAVVDEALATKAALPIATSGEFQREHLRTITAKLVDKVSELEAAQGALEASEARFRSLTESSPIGIFSLDSDHQLSYVNPCLRHICGLRDEKAGAVPTWAELINAHDHDRVVAGLAAAAEGLVRYRDRARVVRPDGETRWVDIQVAPVRQDGEPLTYVGSVEDVTEMIEAGRRRDELEARVRTSERLESLGQLAAGIAHDFNNSLGAILNYAHFVSSDIEILASLDGEDQRLAQMRDDTKVVKKAATRAAELARQLLVFGRGEILRADIVDLNEVIRDAERLLGRTIGEHVRLQSRLEPGLWSVSADRSRLEQVVMNLVVNARDAIGETGTVRITTDNVDLDEEAARLHPGAKAGRYTRLIVADDGAGMTPETVARAFEPFFTTKPKGKGTGLGLATVHGVVNQLGGYIGIYSEPGHGTTVRAYIPAADTPAAQPFVQAPSPRGGRGEAVLVVEDDDDMRALTVRILMQNGYCVTSADRGAVAVAMLEDPAVAIDLILTDVVMPEMSGREVAKHAATTRPDLPVLFMSGYAEDLAANIDDVSRPDVVEKPFTQAALLGRVAAAIGRKPIPAGR